MPPDAAPAGRPSALGGSSAVTPERNSKILQCAACEARRNRNTHRRVGAALAWTQGARFLTTASRLEQLPPPDAQIAFVGRLDAGKVQCDQRASRRRPPLPPCTPGRTQHINLFELGATTPGRLADLPGYGLCAVEHSAKLRWRTDDG